MKKMLYLLTTLLIVSCSSEEAEPKNIMNKESDPLLKPLIDQYYIDASARGIKIEKQNIVAVFADPNKEQDWNSGVFSKSYKEGDTWVIELNYLIIYSSYGNKYKSSVYREISHILLGKDYVYSDVIFSFDIMHVNFNPAEDDGLLWEEMLDILFI